VPSSKQNHIARKSRHSITSDGVNSETVKKFLDQVEIKEENKESQDVPTMTAANALDNGADIAMTAVLG
jgi:hypothetical protein